MEKGYAVAQAGGIGMILANDKGSGDALSLDAHLLPAAHISYTDGESIYQYIQSTK